MNIFATMMQKSQILRSQKRRFCWWVFQQLSAWAGRMFRTNVFRGTLTLKELGKHGRDKGKVCPYFVTFLGGGTTENNSDQKSLKRTTSRRDEGGNEQKLSLPWGWECLMSMHKPQIK